MCCRKCLSIWFLIILVQNVFLESTDCPDINSLKYIDLKMINSNKNGSICVEGEEFFYENINAIEIRCDYRITSKVEIQYVNNVQDLESIFIYNCPVTTMEPWVFTDIPKLQKITVENDNGANLTRLRKNIVNVIPLLESVAIKLGIEHIEEEAFSNLPNLKYVNLNDNNLGYIGENWFINSANVEHFNLVRNNLQTIQSDNFKHLPNLKMLDLSCNRLTAIHSNAFKGLKRLTYLNLHHNQIATISPNFIPVPSTLKLVDLSNNEINFLSELFLERTLKNKVSLFAWENPMICSCLDYIFSWMHNNKIKSDLFRCRSRSSNNAVCIVDKEYPSVCMWTLKPALTAYYKENALGNWSSC